MPVPVLLLSTLCILLRYNGCKIYLASVSREGMERVQELQVMMKKVEPPRRLMGGFGKWLQERQAADNVNGTTGYGGIKIDFK